MSASQPILGRIAGDLSLPAHPSGSSSSATKDPKQQQQRPRELTFSARNRAAALWRASSSSSNSSDLRQDELYQAALAALLAYDRQYVHVRETIKSCCRKYATAILYRERFHAFDEFSAALVSLMHRTADALDGIARWKKCAKQKTKVRNQTKQRGASEQAPIFVWNGQNFVATVREDHRGVGDVRLGICATIRLTRFALFRLLVLVQLSRSLDFLVCYRELVEWYGEEFPLEMNPFLLSKSLVDKAEDMGLALANASGRPVNALRAAVSHLAIGTMSWKQ